MGIPAFYRWLVEKYPRTVVEACDEMPAMVNGVEVPVNTSSPNPNGFEFDNLYLDMNGIIHPCFHPEGLPAPSSYDEVFAYMFKYIDKIFSIVRPRKLLFLSIDGVAPRAKMNQQRSRRFRAAKEAAAQAALSNVCESVLEHVEEKSASPEQLGKMDSNVITPGTEFMDLLSSALRYYISLRLNGDPGWQGIKVIFSDAKVPGEGEHKIMSYIRLQRNLPGFDPNTRHCLYGMDADLIMLALAAHEIQFSILREDVQKQGRKNERGKEGSRARKKRLQNLKNVTEVCGTLEGYISNLNFQFFSVAILREYLSYDMTIPGLTSKPDVERLIDDFVFMCVFVGNDFLPHIPSLEISEGAIDLLMMVYKKEFNQMGGYLTNSFEINLTRVEHFIQALGSHECGIFRRRKQVQNEKDRYFQQYSKGNLASNTVKPLLPSGIGSNSTHDPGAQTSIHSGSNAVVDKKPLLPSGTGSNSSHDPGAQSSIDSGSNAVVDKKPLLPSGTGSNSSHDPGAQTSIDSGSNAVVDKINLGEEGWKERFYAEKFEAKSEDERNRIKTHTVFKYIEGICWVMRYYYDGLCSWQWFYPYHYAPFASDFNGLDQLKIDFVLGEPFKPFDQLMGVLPAASAHALPLNYRKLMTDASSPILDFYPEDCEIDMNGKRFTWQAINKLPFIDESRLLSEIAKVEHTLTDEERERNSLGSDILSIHILHPLAAKIISFYQSNEYYKTTEVASKLEIDPKLSGGMNGYVYVSGKLEVPEKVSSPISDMEMIENNKVIFVFYQCPSFHSHIPRLPDGVIMPRKTVNKHDISDSGVLWHETSTFGRVLLRRSIPNSISGPLLAKLAYLLVSKHCLTRDVTSNDRVVELDLMEPKKKKQGSKKRRRGEVGGDPMSNNIPEESGHVPNNIPQKSDDHLSSKQWKERDGDDYAGEGVVDSGILIKQGESVSQHVVGLDLMEPNLNSSNIPKKSDDLVSSKQLKERDCDDYAGEGGVESGIIMKQGESDSQHVVGLDLMEPKKKKRRSKKRRQGELGGHPISNNIPEESEHVPNSIPQKSDDLLSSKQLEERDGDDYASEGVVDSGILMKQGESISQHVVGLDLMEPNLISSNILEKFDNVPSNILKKSDDLVSSKQLKERDCDDYAGEGEGVVESGIIMKQGESDSQHVVGLDLMEPKKKKRRSKKRRQGEVGGDPISNNIPEEQGEVGCDPISNNIPEESEHVPNSIPQKSDDLLSSKQLEERDGDDYAGEGVVDSGILMKQGESISQHVVGLDLMEPNLISSNILEKFDNVPSNIPKKSDDLVSSKQLKERDCDDYAGEGEGVVESGIIMKQGESDSEHVVGLDLMEPKKKKRKSKKRRRGEVGGDPISNNISEKSEHAQNNISQKSDDIVSSKQLKERYDDDYAGEDVVDSGVLMKQGESVSQHVVGLDLMEPSLILSNIPEKSYHVPNNIPQKSDGPVSSGKLKPMDDNDFSGEGMKWTGPDDTTVVLSMTAPDCVLNNTPIKPEVGGINMVEKFDYAIHAKQGDVVQTGNLGKQVESDVVGMDLVEHKKEKRRPKKRRRGEINDDPISKNIPEKSDHVHIPQQSVGLVSSEQLKQKDGDVYAGEGEVESGILMKQGELDSQHAVGLDLMESKKKKRRRKTSRQGEVGGDPISNNIPEKSEHVPDDIPQESDGFVSLKQMDGDDYAGEGKKMTVSTTAPIKPEVGVINIFEKFDNAVPAKQEGVVQSGTHGESDSERVVGLDLLEPKKKKRRSKKKRDQIDGDLIPAC